MYENSLLYIVNLFEDCSTTSLYCMYLLLQTPQLPLTSMIPLTLTSVPMRGINISCRTCQSLLNNQSSHNAFLQGITLRRLPWFTIRVLCSFSYNIYLYGFELKHYKYSKLIQMGGGCVQHHPLQFFRFSLKLIYYSKMKEYFSVLGITAWVMVIGHIIFGAIP